MISAGSYAAYFLLAYLLGALPVGTIAARLAGKGNLFEPGQRTTMKTGEVFRILGMGLGILVTALDILKGLTAVWPLIILVLGPASDQIGWAVSTGGLLAVIGHCNSIFLGFRGGRGLATTFGVLLAILPVPAILSFIVWGCLSFWGLSTSPGALSAAGAMPLFSIPYIWWVRPDELDFLYIVAFLSLWTIWEHRPILRSYLGLGNTTPPPPIVPAGNPTEKTER